MKNNYITLSQRYYELYDLMEKLCKNIANLFSDWERPNPDVTIAQTNLMRKIEDFLIKIENEEVELNWYTVKILNKMIKELDICFCDLQDNQYDKIRYFNN